MDSVMRESMRMHPHRLFSVARHIGEDLHLSDGTAIPKNNFVGFANYAMNYDPKRYENPETFDGFRFERIRAKAEEAGDTKTEAKAHLTMTSPDWIGFGHGKHACPGRFFATNEVRLKKGPLLSPSRLSKPHDLKKPQRANSLQIKLLIGHLITEYDFRLEHPEAGRPKSSMVEANLTPSREARVMFRKRG